MVSIMRLGDTGVDIYSVIFAFSFNRIDMPPYKTYDALVAKLSLAVEETLGFGQE